MNTPIEVKTTTIQSVKIYRIRTCLSCGKEAHLPLRGKGSNPKSCPNCGYGKK